MMPSISSGKERESILVCVPSMPPEQEYLTLIHQLWNSRHITNMGDFHEQLEKELADYLGVRNILLYTNGHVALEAALQVYRFPAGSEVITTPYTYISTTQAILRSQLKPVFCDIDSETLSLDPEQVKEKITDRTVAILPVHVYGRVGDVESLQIIADQFNLKLIFDAAHAFGVRYKNKGIGSFGDISMFSLHATKVFNTVEGGCLAFEDDKLTDSLRALRSFGEFPPGVVSVVAGNGKMTEFHAAMGLCNLRHVDEYISYRRRLFTRYDKALSKVDGIELPLKKQSDVEPNASYYPIVLQEGMDQRDWLFERLKERQIFTRKYFYPSTNEFSLLRDSSYYAPTPISRRYSESVICLPLHTQLTFEQQDRVIDTITELLESAGR